MSTFRIGDKLVFAAMAAALVTFGSPTSARDLNAGFVIETMSALEQYAFVAGIVEGLATIDFDSGDAAVSECIYAWFYDDADSMKNTFAAFAYFPERRPGEVIQAIIAQRCPP